MASYYRLYNGDTEIYSVGAANGISEIKLNSKSDGTSTLTFNVDPTNNLARLSNFYDYENPVRLTGARPDYTMFVGVFAKTERQHNGIVKVTCEDVLMALDRMYIRLGDSFAENVRQGITRLTISDIMYAIKEKVEALSTYTTFNFSYVLETPISSDMVEVSMTERLSVLDVLTKYVTGPRGLMLTSYSATWSTDGTAMRVYIVDGIAQRTTSTTYQYAPDTIESGKNLTSIKVTKAEEAYNAVTAYGGKRKTPVRGPGSGYDTRWRRTVTRAASVGANSITIKADSSHYVSLNLYKGSYIMIPDYYNNEIFYELAIDDDSCVVSGTTAITVTIRPALQTDCAINKDVFLYPAEWFDEDTFLGWTENEVTLDSNPQFDPTVTQMRLIRGQNTAVLSNHAGDTIRAVLFEDDGILDQRVLAEGAYKELLRENSGTTLMLEVNGIDPVLLDGLNDFYPMRVGAKYKVIDASTNTNVEMAICEAHIDVCSPERSTFVFGAMRKSTASALRSQSKATQEVRSRIQAG